MNDLLNKLKADFPELEFEIGNEFSWSPRDKQITYREYRDNDDVAATWALLHEVSHALLEHHVYTTDLELLMMEVEAWEKADSLASAYGYSIDSEHIQDCLDTYRDWLDLRSTCPACGNTSLQHNARTYRCFNCRTEWQVSASRFCRPYRQTSRSNKKTPSSEKPLTTFI